MSPAQMSIYAAIEAEKAAVAGMTAHNTIVQSLGNNDYYGEDAFRLAVDRLQQLSTLAANTP
jgi:hypothetical protein